MKGNVFSEVLVRGMSMLRHSWSWVLLHPQHLKNCIWAPTEWPPLLPGESRNYPTITQVKQHTVWLPHHRGNILPCSVALCLKFQVCVLQHHIFLHIYFVCLQNCTVGFEEKGTGHRVVHFYSFWLEIQHICISSSKTPLLLSYPGERGFSSPDSRQANMICSKETVLSHKLSALTWSTSGFYEIPLQRLRGMNVSRENHTGHVTLEEVRRKSIWHLICLMQLEDYLNNRTANWLQTRGWI